MERNLLLKKDHKMTEELINYKNELRINQRHFHIIRDQIEICKYDLQLVDK